jgi:hypothetical protein
VIPIPDPSVPLVVGQLISPRWYDFLNAIASGMAYERLIAGSVPANSAALEVKLSSPYLGGYRGIQVKLAGFVPVNNVVDLWLTISADGGATYLNTGYHYSFSSVTDAGTQSLTGNSNDSKFLLVPSMSNVAAYGVNLSLELLNHGDVSKTPRPLWSAYQIGGAVAVISGGGTFAGATSVNALKFAFSSGNIASGAYEVIGIR